MTSFIAECNDIIARLKALLPHAEVIDAELFDMVPTEKPRIDQRRTHSRGTSYAPGDPAYDDACEFWQALSSLETNMVGALEEAIRYLEVTIEERTEALVEAKKARLKELEAEARELRSDVSAH